MKTKCVWGWADGVITFQAVYAAQKWVLYFLLWREAAENCPFALDVFIPERLKDVVNI